jgi:hypothetical protein
MEGFVTSLAGGSVVWASSGPYERDLAEVESWVGRGVLHTNIMLQREAPVESRKSHGDLLFGAVYLFRQMSSRTRTSHPVGAKGE